MNYKQVVMGSIPRDGFLYGYYWASLDVPTTLGFQHCNQLIYPRYYPQNEGNFLKGFPKMFIPSKRKKKKKNDLKIECTNYRN